MIRTILFSTALLITAPALAQGTTASQATTGTGTPAQPSSPQSSMPQSPASQAASPESSATAVASIVDTEFPAYDVNKDGQLDQSEFSRWMVALKDQEIKATGKTLSPDQVSAWASGAFTTADKDKSTSVSKPELIAYLSGGA